jgi:hypothetical protein
MSHHSLPLRLARWLDDRFTDIGLVPSSQVRLYGIDLLDPDGLGVDPAAARTTFIAEGHDLDGVLMSSEATRALDFDAAAVVEHPWLNIVQPQQRPGEFPRRRRGRMVRVITFDGRGATVCRCGDMEVVSEHHSGDAAA